LLFRSQKTLAGEESLGKAVQRYDRWYGRQVQANYNIRYDYREPDTASSPPTDQGTLQGSDPKCDRNGGTPSREASRVPPCPDQRPGVVAGAPKSTLGATSDPGAPWKYGRGWKPIIGAKSAAGKRRTWVL